MIFWGHGYLVVARIYIQEGQPLVADDGVNHLVNLWKWIVAFWACLVEIGVVEAHLPVPVLFHYDNIRNSGRIPNFSYKPYLKESVDFVADDSIPL